MRTNKDWRRAAQNAAIGQQLKNRRRAANITHRDFAAMVGLPEKTLYNIELGHVACPVHALIAAAEVLDVTLDDLVPVITDAEARHACS